jgi:exodeoxyribonuclease VII large subunit
MNNKLIPEYRVEELVKNIKTVLEGAFTYLKIIGEISDFKKSSSGHYYFNLKENDSLINTVLFRTNLLNTNLVLQNGLEVVCYGKLTTYISRSNYQIIVESVRINGEGRLQKIIDERKKKLKQEGLFDRKRKLPKHIKKVGVITSESGAAIKDIEIKLKDRLPLDVFLYPSLVQGNEAENSIIKGIEFFNKNFPDLDVLVITRGGGSAEDLMCFNGEELARAVFNSKIPTISAVGHEVDWTIIDFTADLRLPTPTAVGEFLSPLKSECERRLNYIFVRILKTALYYYKGQGRKVDYLMKNIVDVLVDILRNRAGKVRRLMLKIGKFDRKRILKQGYAIIEKNSKMDDYKSKFEVGEELIIVMYNKRLTVKVSE